MKFFQRIKNIWKLSELEIQHATKIIRDKKEVQLLEKKMATIVDMTPEVNIND